MVLLATNSSDDKGEFANLREVDGGAGSGSEIASAAVDGAENTDPPRRHDHLNRVALLNAKEPHTH